MTRTNERRAEMERRTQPGYEYHSCDFMDDGVYIDMNLLREYEDTGLTPPEIMELNESVQRLDKIFGDEITVDQVIDFFVDFYIAQCDDERVEAAELLTNEEVERYKQLKERDTAKAPEVFDGHWYKCPKCGMYAGGLKGNFCHRCGQRLKWED